MSPCSGAPAKEHALPYIEGTLPEFEAERFEEHYFDCPACFAYVQALQAVGAELACQPAVQLDTLPRRRPLAWPTRVWALGAAAALVLMGIFGFRILSHRPAQPSQAHSSPAPAPVTTPSPEPAVPPIQGTATQLADLTLPAFAGANLRGAGEDVHFDEGMSAYGHGNCQAALAKLLQVPADDAAARVAHFYAASCQMHKGDLDAAAASFKRVADAGDSLQQESALYYLAQIALARNNPEDAHRYLLRTISLRGDLEKRARLQDEKVRAMVKAGKDAGINRPTNK